MTDQEIVDALDRLGIVEQDHFRPGMYSWPFHGRRYEPAELVKLWDIAGAVTEACRERGFTVIVEPEHVYIIAGPGEGFGEGRGERPRAIIEAGVKALEG